MTAIGGSTSIFFEALREAGVFEAPVTETGEIRNPGYSNPPVVGYKITEKMGFVGDPIFLGFSDDLDDLVDSLLEWV